MDGEIRERRISDRKVKVAWQRSLVEINAANDLFGIESARDAGGDGIVLDADEYRVAGQKAGSQTHEQAAPASRLENLSPAEAEKPSGLPHGPDDIFGRVMGILRRPLERLKLNIGRFRDQAVPQLLPTFSKAARAIGEDVVG